MQKIATLAIKFSYIGKNYHGLALNLDECTIASELIKALKLTHIYYKDPTFCGRTDAKVSAKCMIASIEILMLSDNINYTAMLNSKLPKDILIEAYAILDDFNARFDCVQRHYKYYFCDYDPRMEYVLDKLKTTTNFRSLCRRERIKCTRLSKDVDFKCGLLKCKCVDDKKYIRNIDSIKIVYDGNLYYLDVRARSFLHNMIRKMFWLIDAYSKGIINEEDVNLICEGKGTTSTAKPENLVFCCGKYKKNIEWVVDCNKMRYLKEKIIENAINKFIYEC